MSAFVDALRVNLKCPKCPAMNRPGAYLIELDREGQAVCNQCGTSWSEPMLTRTVRSAT